MINITELLDLQLPLFQAPLACYPNQAQLVAAVSENGALGILSTAQKSLVEIEESLDSIQAATDKSFAVTVDVTDGDDSLDLADRSQVNKYLSAAYQALAIDAGEAPTLPSANEIIDLLIEKKPAAIIFENGLPSDEIISQCTAQNLTVMALVSNTLEAIAANKVVDIIILQGSESAGMHSRFANDLNTPAFPSSTLLQHALANTTKPLVIWGDAQFPQHVVSALINGAASVMLDTLFWTTQESPIPDSYRNALLTQHNEMQTTLSHVWTGHPAQTLKNALTESLQRGGSALPTRKQQRIMQPIIQAAIAQDNPDYMPLWAGLCAISTEKTVAQLCEKFLEELNEIIT